MTIPGNLLRFTCAVLAPAIILTACAKKGLVSEEYDPQFYQVPRKIDFGPHESNPRFLAYGDTQSGTRIREKFARKEAWWTPKAFIFPFYYLYNIGQGVVGGVNYLRHKPDYGNKERRLVRDVVYAEVLDSRPDFVIDLGDICAYDGRRPEHWATFIQENRFDVPLLDEVVFVPVIGNHERANDERYGYPNFRAVFDYPRFYVLDFPDVALFVLDTDFVLDQNQHIDDGAQDELFEKWFVSAESSAEKSWLEKELASHRQKFKIVAMHHPLISVGRHYSDWTNPDYGNNLAEKRRDLLDLLFDEGVQLMMAGHEHVYEHNIVRRTGTEDVIHMLITSGGGAPIRSLPDDEEIHRRLLSFSDSGFTVDNITSFLVHHYSVVEVDTGSLVINTVGVDPDIDPPYPVLETITIDAD
jgi:hypothetical protein